MGAGLGRRSSQQRGQGEVGGSPCHGTERSDGACLAVCCVPAAGEELPAAAEAKPGRRVPAPGNFPAAGLIRPIPAPGFTEVSSIAHSEI